MAYGEKITTSIFGRRLGLQKLTTGISGASAEQEFLVGPGDIRVGVTTAETTSTNLKPHGLSNCPGTSAGSSSVYTLDPPVPGVWKTIAFVGSSANVTYVKTANGETFSTTMGTSFTTIKSSNAGSLVLLGLTTSIWLIPGLTTGTSSNAGGFTLTTST